MCNLEVLEINVALLTVQHLLSQLINVLQVIGSLVGNPGRTSSVYMLQLPLPTPMSLLPCGGDSSGRVALWPSTSTQEWMQFLYKAGNVMAKLSILTKYLLWSWSSFCFLLLNLHWSIHTKVYNNFHFAICCDYSLAPRFSFPHMRAWEWGYAVIWPYIHILHMHSDGAHIWKGVL